MSNPEIEFMPTPGRLYESKSGHFYQCLFLANDLSNDNVIKIVFRDTSDLNKIMICDKKSWSELLK